jgi:hypothetical protein
VLSKKVRFIMNWDDVEDLLRQAGMNPDCVTFAKAYAEPGYSDPKSGILFGDWNHAKRQVQDPDDDEDCLIDVGTLLERHGYVLEWEDEWCVCGNCNNAVRTSPDSYCWTRYYLETDGDIYCADCVKDDQDLVLQTFVGRSDRALTFECPLEEWGFVKLPLEFERGLYGGQSADPTKIGNALNRKGFSDWIFTVDDVGQFDSRFSVWVWVADGQELPTLTEDEINGIDPAVMLDRGLRALSPH